MRVRELFDGIRWIAAGCLVMILILFYFSHNNKLTLLSEQNRDELKAIVNDSTGRSGTDPDTSRDHELDNDKVNLDQEDIMPDYSMIAARYPDFKGWIQIRPFDIDYPIFVDHNNPYKYERMTRDGKVSNLGEIGYLGLPGQSDNLVIFGHSLTDGSGFTAIDHFPDLSDQQQADTVVILDLYGLMERKRYRVVHAEYYPKGEDIFCTTDFANLIDYQSFLNEEAGLKNYQGQLLTLYTCKNHSSTWHTVLYCVPVD